jgi:hypothetical protein
VKAFIVSTLVLMTATISQAKACDAGGFCTDKAGLYMDLKSFSQRSACPTLSDSESLKIAKAIINNKISYIAFQEAYTASCDKDFSQEISSSLQRTRTFIELREFSRLSTCQTFSNIQALAIADKVLDGSIVKGSFKKAYNQTCNSEAALVLSVDVGLTNTTLDIFQFSKSSTCQTFEIYQAKNIAELILSGENDIADFKMVYGASCNLHTALEASRCLDK